jgi:glutathione peroxidase
MMRRSPALFLLVLLFAGGCSVAGSARTEETAPGVQEKGKPMKSFYDFELKDITGKNVKLEAYKGKTVLVVNVASQCGYTPQYEGLQALYSKYKDQGFVILGFPANNFGSQEPGSDDEIKTFCSTKYNVTFPMFSKISVKGGDQHPLYQSLTAEGGQVSWNFNKFLIDRNGKLIKRYDSNVEPESDTLTQAIETSLK